MTDLDGSVYDVLAGMPVLPRSVGLLVLGRLGRIERAMEERIMEGGTILVQFEDCAGDVVVLSMTICPGRAFLDISTSEDAIAISNGYSFTIRKDGVDMDVDENHRMTEVDHADLVRTWLETERTLDMIAAARKLMRSHPVFKDRA